MLMLCSTGRDCVMVSYWSTSFQFNGMNLGNIAAVVRQVVAPTAELPSLFQGTVIESISVCTCIVVVVHLWGRLSAVQVVRHGAFEVA